MSRNSEVRSVGRCARHDKQLFSGKRAAKAAAKTLHPGEQLRAYPCDHTGLWHIGHLDDKIIQGKKTRSGRRVKG